MVLNNPYALCDLMILFFLLHFFQARKAVRRLRDAGRFNILIQGHTVKNQTSSTLSYLHSWCNVQSQIRARRICMVTEGRLKQKKMENQMKLEAKLHELEVIMTVVTYFVNYF